MGVSLMAHVNICFIKLEELTLRRTVTNVVPSSMTLTSHVVRDVSLCSEVRQGLADTIEPGAWLKFDLKKLEKQPLLLSLYAETLRFGVQIHVPRTSPHRDLNIRNMLIPQNKLMLVNTWLAHTDENVWNTKAGAFPLDSFWAQRFLIDPNDPSSGPTKKRSQPRATTESSVGTAREPYFSTEGLEGAWIPYGGKFCVSP